MCRPCRALFSSRHYTTAFLSHRMPSQQTSALLCSARERRVCFAMFVPIPRYALQPVDTLTQQTTVVLPLQPHATSNLYKPRETLNLPPLTRMQAFRDLILFAKSRNATIGEEVSEVGLTIISERLFTDKLPGSTSKQSLSRSAARTARSPPMI